MEKRDRKCCYLTCVAGGETGHHGEVCRGNNRGEPSEIRDQTVFRPEAPTRGLGMGQHQTPRRLDCFLALPPKVFESLVCSFSFLPSFSLSLSLSLSLFFYVRLYSSSLIGTPYY